MQIMNLRDPLCSKTYFPNMEKNIIICATTGLVSTDMSMLENATKQTVSKRLTHVNLLCVSDLPRRRPLHSQRGNKAAPQPVPSELLRGMLQATRDRV